MVFNEADVNGTLVIAEHPSVGVLPRPSRTESHEGRDLF